MVLYCPKTLILVIKYDILVSKFNNSMNIFTSFMVHKAKIISLITKKKSDNRLLNKPQYLRYHSCLYKQCWMSCRAKCNTVRGLFESLTLIMAVMILYEPYMQIWTLETISNKWFFFKHCIKSFSVILSFLSFLWQ